MFWEILKALILGFVLSGAGAGGCLEEGDPKGNHEAAVSGIPARGILRASLEEVR